MDADGLLDHVRRRLGVGLGGTTADDAFTLESVFCLGNCALAPAVMVVIPKCRRISPASDMGRNRPAASSKYSRPRR